MHHVTTIVPSPFQHGDSMLLPAPSTLLSKVYQLSEEGGVEDWLVVGSSRQHIELHVLWCGCSPCMMWSIVHVQKRLFPNCPTPLWNGM